MMAPETRHLGRGGQDLLAEPHQCCTHARRSADLTSNAHCIHCLLLRAACPFPTNCGTLLASSSRMPTGESCWSSRGTKRPGISRSLSKHLAFNHRAPCRHDMEETQWHCELVVSGLGWGLVPGCSRLTCPLSGSIPQQTTGLSPNDFTS